MSLAARIMDLLMASGGDRLSLRDLVVATGATSTAVSSRVGKMVEFGRVSAAATAPRRNVYWLSPHQAEVEGERRALGPKRPGRTAKRQAPAPAAAPTPNPVASEWPLLPPDAVSLAAALRYLDGLLARPAFVGDAMLRTIRGHYWAALVVARNREDAE